jgi:hypothetical protein
MIWYVTYGLTLRVFNISVKEHGYDFNSRAELGFAVKGFRFKIQDLRIWELGFCAWV